MSCALVPAAGSASRFGGGKLLVAVDGAPMLDRTMGTLLDAGIDELLVIVPPGAAWQDTIRLLEDRRVRTKVNPDPSQGMFSSVQLGLQDLSDTPIAVLPGDMPFVRAETVRNLIEVAAVRTSAIVSPRYNGRRGHPVMLPLGLRESILAAPATATLNDVLRPHAARFVNIDVTDPGVLHDVDALEDLVP
jgi:molybdenum cofactor cytidylyltransferase